MMLPVIIRRHHLMLRGQGDAIHTLGPMDPAGEKASQYVLTLHTPDASHDPAVITLTWLPTLERFLIAIENPRGHRVYIDTVPRTGPRTD